MKILEQSRATVDATELRLGRSMNDTSRSASGVSRVSTLRGAGGDGAGQPDWSGPGIEPALADVMNEPIIHLIMRRDSLTPGDVWSVINAARRRLKRTAKR